MTESFKPLSNQALKLTAAQRMSLATLLLESLTESTEVNKRFLRELNKRADDLRTGEVAGLTTEKAYGFSL